MDATRLYKYADQNGIAILQNMTVKASKASEFNDPFELSPRIDPAQFTRDRIRRALQAKKRIERLYLNLRAKGLVGNKREFKREYRRKLPEQVEAVCAELPRNVEDVRKRFAEEFSRHWRILCVSRVFDSILMWSHYADKHKGLVVEFDMTHPKLAGWSKHSCFPVDYEDQKAEFIFDSSSPEQFVKSLLAVARTKSPEWHYEQEVRFILPAPDDGGVLYRIEPTAIRKVILGARASSAFVQQTREVLDQPLLSHIMLERASLSETEFKLEFSPVALGTAR